MKVIKRILATSLPALIIVSLSDITGVYAASQKTLQYIQANNQALINCTVTGTDYAEALSQLTSDTKIRTIADTIQEYDEGMNYLPDLSGTHCTMYDYSISDDGNWFYVYSFDNFEQAAQYMSDNGTYGVPSVGYLLDEHNNIAMYFDVNAGDYFNNEYSYSGLLTKRTCRDGSYYTYKYDKYNRLSDMTLYNKSSGGYYIASSIHYTYKNGLLVKSTEKAIPYTETYSYNEAGQLVKTHIDYGTEETVYSYNTDGTLASFTGSGYSSDGSYSTSTVIYGY